MKIIIIPILALILAGGTPALIGGLIVGEALVSHHTNDPRTCPYYIDRWGYCE